MSSPKSPSKKRLASSNDSAQPAKKGKYKVNNYSRTVDSSKPLDDFCLYSDLMDLQKSGSKASETGKSVVYWMRNKDMRLKDNRALAMASAKSQELSIPLIALHVFSPGDYKSHDRSACRIDFMLRNLRDLRKDLDKLNIPLVTPTVTPRKAVPGKVIDMLKEWGAYRIYANIEYEVDELRRDMEVCRLGKDEGIEATFLNDYVIAKPGSVNTQAGKPYTVFSPFFKNWSAQVAQNTLDLTEESPYPSANDESVASSFASLFDNQIPESIEGFELSPEDAAKFKQLWPSGEEVPHEILRRFMECKTRSNVFFEGGLTASSTQEDEANSRVKNYTEGRSRTDLDGSTKLSPYLSTGVISLRAVLRKCLEKNKGKLATERSSGMGSFVQELGFRDFYQHVLVSFPRVCMGRNFLIKYDGIVWEDKPEHLQAWKDGKTGYPFVDAAMRQMNEMGWMHNRGRMSVASFLCKHLMIDWRLGEKYFSEKLIDHDLALNNAGWQWSASTGTDPQPYFRIFNPVSQAEKADPNGDYIRHFIPELRSVKGKAVHDPFNKLSKAEFKKLGYPEPIVEHKFARKRAIARFKEPGFEGDE